MTLNRLVYLSSNTIVSSAANLRTEVDQILGTSRRNNALVGVTGALMFSSGYFGQVLEGPQAAIEMTFERIQQDARHSNVRLLEFKPVNARVFQTWAMAYVGEQTDASMAGWHDGGLDMSVITGEALVSKLHTLVSKSAMVA